MIESINIWCENLIVIVCLITLVEMLVPDGINKKYIKVINGIFLMFVVLNPIIDIVDNKKQNYSFLENFKTDVVCVSQNNEIINKVYEDGMIRQIKSDLKKVEVECLDVEFDFDDKCEKITKIRIKILNDVKNKNEIKEYLMKNYFVELEDIIISV